MELQETYDTIVGITFETTSTDTSDTRIRTIGEVALLASLSMYELITRISTIKVQTYPDAARLPVVWNGEADGRSWSGLPPVFMTEN